jgi:hypothetical protein
VLDLKKAVYAKIVSDAGIMQRLGSQPPYPGRLHETAVVSKRVAAIVVDSQVDVGQGPKETALIRLRIMAESHDLVERVFDDLRRLFSVGRLNWARLDVPAAKVLVRLESGLDNPEPDSNVFVKVASLRFMVARSA